VKLLASEWLASAADASGFPSGGRPEIAVLGRSNVGKSSLLNRLVNRRSLARTSGTPGKTRLLHFYRVRTGAGELVLVDLPGYGFARVSKAERERWKGMVEGYLADREPLRVAVLLQDVRRDLSDDEHLLIEGLAERGVPAVLALTKCDKLPRGQLANRVRALRGQSRLPDERLVATSASSGLGIDALWGVLGGFL